jgi:hypothetical protein
MNSPWPGLPWMAAWCEISNSHSRNTLLTKLWTEQTNQCPRMRQNTSHQKRAVLAQEVGSVSSKLSCNAETYQFSTNKRTQSSGLMRFT